VEAAPSRFLLEGVDGASLRSIARDAGTSIGMVYYYFKTKDELFLAVIETAYRGLLVDFSAATLPVRSVLVAPPGILDAKRWREQLKGGLRLGATVGSTNAAEVDKLAASLAGVRTNNSFSSNEAVFAALDGNPRTLDAALVDLPQYWTTGKQKGLVLVDSVGQPQSMAIVLRKGSPLKAEVDQFLESFTHSSDYFQLIRRYFGGDAEQMVRLSRGQG